jgi:hypothetical protein
MEFENLIGLTVEDAQKALADEGSIITEIRVMAEDGEHYFGTCDMCIDRISVGLTEGVISEIMGVG